MEIIYLEQGTPEWFQARLGSIGGSSISAAVAGGTGSTRQTLMYRLVGEIISGVWVDGYKSPAMLQGTERQPEATTLYEIVVGCSVDITVGLIKDHKHKHISPDGLVGDNGMIEIKCPQIPAHIETLDKQKVPSQYVKQIQWSIQRAQKEWVDFVSYCPEIVTKPIFIKRCYRDEKLIAKLEDGANAFIEEMLSLVERISK